MPDILVIQLSYPVTLSETKGLAANAPIRSSENAILQLMSQNDTTGWLEYLSVGP